MATLTYDGTAKDHEVIPEILKRSKRTGKPIHRAVVRPARTVFKQLGVFDLRGMKFPKGEELTISDKDVIKKAVNIGCFMVKIQKDEPITRDKDWLAVAEQTGRVELVEKLGKAKAPKAARKQATPEYTDDGYDKTRKPELVRLMSTRGLSVHTGMTPDDMRATLRRSDARARAAADVEERSAALSLSEDSGDPVEAGDLDPDDFGAEIRD